MHEPMNIPTVRPCPLCGDNLDVEWRVDNSTPNQVAMDFQCPACEGQGAIYAIIGHVTPVQEG